MLDLLALALLAGPRLLQDAPTPAPKTAQQPPEEAEEVGLPQVDIQVVVGVVGRDLILREEVDAVVRRELARGRVPAGDLRARQELMEQVWLKRVDELAMINAGRNVGLDEETTRAFAERAMERRIEGLGGAVEASRVYQQEGLGPEQLLALNEERLYLDQWELTTTGAIPPHLGRPIVDRYIRPGQRWASYQYLKESPFEREREVVGMQPERFVLQRLVLPFGSDEDGTETQELARSILRGLEAGADFDDLARVHGLPQAGDGRLQPATLAEVRAAAESFHGSAELAEWVAKAEPGDVSGIQLGASAEWPGGRGLLLYRLLDVAPPTEAQPYLDFELQARLDRVAKSELDGNRIQNELRRIKRHTFIWPRDRGAGPLAEEADSAAELGD